MAEIRVEPKQRSMVWLWLLILIAVAAAVAWYLMSDGRAELPSAGALAPTTSPTLAALVALAAPKAPKAPSALAPSSARTTT